MFELVVLRGYSSAPSLTASDDGDPLGGQRDKTSTDFIGL
jgi:hypothetical protein